MNGTTLFLVGAIAISNVGFLGYLLLDRNHKLKKGKPEDTDKDSPPEEAPSEESAPVADDMIGKSTFSMDDIMDFVDKRVDERVQQLIDEKKLGDVKLGDVEFANKADEPSEEEIKADEEKATSEARMTKEQEDKAFNDVRIQDIETDEVSAPAASGTTMEEIEESVNDALNPNAPVERRRRAAVILCPLIDTNMMDHFVSDDKVRCDVLNCLKLAMHRDLMEKPKPPVKPAPSKPQPAVRKRAEFTVASNLDDFNPADLLK